MRGWTRTLLVLLVLAGIALAGWGYVGREALRRQWACYRVAAAESFEQAQAELAWFETGPECNGRLRELVRRWGTGNQRFDLYLAAHTSSPDASETLRAAFSVELGRRAEALARWAHYWSYRCELAPAQQVASVLDYFDALYTAPASGTVTWREVLDLQAALSLIGAQQRCRGLSPTTWREHYRVWLETRPPALPPVTRPQEPLPDGVGPGSAAPEPHACGHYERPLKNPGLRADAAWADGEEVAWAAYRVVGIGDRGGGGAGRETVFALAG